MPCQKFTTSSTSTSIPQPLSPRGERGFNYADLSIYKSHVAFYLKLNVQKSLEVIPLSPGKKYTYLSILDLYPPAPFSFQKGPLCGREKGEKILLRVSRFKVPRLEERDLG